MNEIEEYIKINCKAKGTKEHYKSILNIYFDIINKKPDTYFNGKKNIKQYQEDVKKYFNSFDQKRTSPLTIRTKMSAIKTYLLMHDIEFKASWWKLNIKNQLTGKGARSRDTVPENHELKQILSHADCRGRAFFLTLCTSGMRIGELCKITKNNVDFNNDPVEIDILAEYTKGGYRRLSFMTDEAAAALKEWLKVRQKYLDDLDESVKGRFTCYKNKDGRTQGYTINRNDRRVFPFNPAAARVMWEKLVTNAGFNKKDESTKRLKMHPHTLRKWYITTMKQHMPEPVVDKIVGHVGYLSQSYDRFTEKDMARMYKENCGHLAIFETVKEQNLTEINESLKEKDEEIQKMKTEMQETKAEMQEMKMKLLELLVSKHDEQLNGKQKK